MWLPYQKKDWQAPHPLQGALSSNHSQWDFSRLQITPFHPTMFMLAMLCSQFLFRPEALLLCARGVGLQQSIQAADYKSIVSVIPKEGLAWILPPKPSFGMTTTKIFWPVLVWHCSFGYWWMKLNLNRYYNVYRCQCYQWCFLAWNGNQCFIHACYIYKSSIKMGSSWFLITCNIFSWRWKSPWQLMTLKVFTKPAGLEITGFPDVRDTQKWWRKPRFFNRVSDRKPGDCQVDGQP